MYAGFVLASSLTLFHYVHSYCTFHGLKQEITGFGTVRHYCEHVFEDQQNSGEEAAPPSKPLQLMPGSSFETLNCRVCTCTDYGYICCRKGIASRLFYTPPGCMVKADGCNAVFVLASNPNLDCFTKMPIKHTRLIHKMNALMNKHKQAAASGEGEGSPTTTMSPYDPFNMAPAYPNNKNSPAFGDFLFKLSHTAFDQTTPGGGGENEGGATTTMTPPLDLFNLFNNKNGPANDPFFMGNSKSVLNGFSGMSDPYANLFGHNPSNLGQNLLSKNIGHATPTPPED